MQTRYIDPLKTLAASLLTVEKPARYTGGEYGRLCPPDPAASGTLKTVIAFPDLYEIGMSNQALRILYNSLNRAGGILCDRAFAPAPDFEELLRAKGLPLYGLDTGISLKDTDLLMFTLGYELGLNGIFSMLDISGIPLRCRDRADDDPVVLMGGPCVSNPLPYSDFIDAFWIGEAEGGFFDLAKDLARIKASGGGRQALLQRLVGHESVWTKGKGRALRAIDLGFSAGENGPAIFPVPSMKVVHQHGPVEIMRGCPNGCRYCHAGFWYRPMRQKDARVIEAETEAFIRRGGYREITLSSLSSGDYGHLDSLIERLNNTYRGQRVSFQLPSLKVSSFSLNLLEKISQVRKSGLTFAVETPVDFWQMAINKKVSGEDVVSILKEARRRGWRTAKFYFMIGLPLESPRDSGGSSGGREFASEEEEIAAFIERISGQTGMRFTINVGAFVPKPHTPFQWAGQLSREEAEKKLNVLRVRLKPQGHKVGVQDALLSVLEGIMSRGDERAGEVFEEAYRFGCRLDPWSEYLKRDVWERLVETHKSLVSEFLGEKDRACPLPWSSVDSGMAAIYVEKELSKSQYGELTSQCIRNCTNPCGICEKGASKASVVQNTIQDKVFSQPPLLAGIAKTPDAATFRILFSFSKQGSCVFQPHLALLEILSMAFVRARIPVLYSRGFNPLPRLDIASPLSLGISAKGEIATIDTEEYIEAEQCKERLNAVLPDGLSVCRAMNFLVRPGEKKHSVSSLLWGYVYAGRDGATDMVSAAEEKPYRASRHGADGSVYGMERLSVLARPPKAPAAEPGVSYFEVYQRLYPR
ncbi:MAG: TIGR03936 family radical SAM-associated protein [Treponema sp.]|nr:TIGR03936 family radical SAM-associated protein [Treponema sp.]